MPLLEQAVQNFMSIGEDIGLDDNFVPQDSLDWKSPTIYLGSDSFYNHAAMIFRQWHENSLFSSSAHSAGALFGSVGRLGFLNIGRGCRRRFVEHWSGGQHFRRPDRHGLRFGTNHAQNGNRAGT
jgi:hypothetical protein